jgi:hypothetical protein
MFCGIFYSYFFRPSRDFPAGFLIGLRFVESNLGGVPSERLDSKSLSHKKSPEGLISYLQENSLLLFPVIIIIIIIIIKDIL